MGSETPITNGPLIYQLMPQLMEKIGAISKDRKNPVGFKYRGIEDALNHLQPALIELAVCVEIECRDLKTESFVEKGKEKDRLIYHTILLMDVVFVAADGSKSKRTAAGEGLDTAGDKATNKAMAAAFKYAIFLGLCIPVEDGGLDDPDQHGRKTEPVQTPATQVIPTLPTLPTLPAVPGVPAISAGPTGLALTAPPSVGLPMAETTRQAIIQLIQSLDIPAEIVKSLIEKHGGTNLHDVPAAGGAAILAKLKEISTQQQATVVF